MADIEAVALLPCPFCGEQPRVVKDDSYDSCQVFCICDIEPAVARRKADLAEAFAIWNRRAYTATPADAAVQKFAEAILHGDEAHRDWLMRAAEQFVRNGTVPPPVMSNPLPADAARLCKWLEDERTTFEFDQSQCSVGELEHYRIKCDAAAYIRQQAADLAQVRQERDEARTERQRIEKLAQEQGVKDGHSIRAAEARAEALQAALEACVKAHETGRFEPAQAAYNNACNTLADTETPNAD